jgi:hypothetical protein
MKENTIENELNFDTCFSRNGINQMSIIKQKTKIIQCCFSKMNREQRHQYHVIGGDTLTLSKVTKYLIIHINWTRSLKCWILLSKTYLSSVHLWEATLNNFGFLLYNRHLINSISGKAGIKIFSKFVLTFLIWEKLVYWFLFDSRVFCRQ